MIEQPGQPKKEEKVLGAGVAAAVVQVLVALGVVTAAEASLLLEFAVFVPAVVTIVLSIYARSKVWAQEKL